MKLNSGSIRLAWGVLVVVLCAGGVSAPAWSQETYRPTQLKPSQVTPQQAGAGGKAPTIVLQQTGVTVDRLGQDELQIYGLEQLTKQQKAQLAAQQNQIATQQNQIAALQSALQSLQSAFAKHTHNVGVSYPGHPCMAVNTYKVGTPTGDQWVPLYVNSNQCGSTGPYTETYQSSAPLQH